MGATPGVAAAMAALYPATGGERGAMARRLTAAEAAEAEEEAALVMAERNARSRRSSTAAAGGGGMPALLLPPPPSQPLSPTGAMAGPSSSASLTSPSSTAPLASPADALNGGTGVESSRSWATPATAGAPPAAWYLSPASVGSSTALVPRGERDDGDGEAQQSSSRGAAADASDGLSFAARLELAGGGGGGGTGGDGGSGIIIVGGADGGGMGGGGDGDGGGEVLLPAVWDVPGGTACARASLPLTPPAGRPNMESVAAALTAAYAMDAHAATVAATTAALALPMPLDACAGLDTAAAVAAAPSVWVSVRAAEGGEVGLALAAVAAAAAAEAGARPAAAVAAAALAMEAASGGAGGGTVHSGSAYGGGGGGGGGTGGGGSAAFTPAQVRSTLLSALANPAPYLPKLSLGIGTVSTMKANGTSMLEYDGLLWKVGGAARTLRRRRYYLQQNFLYWYSAHSEGEPRGVLYLEGSYVRPVADAAAEAKGYYGFSIHTSSSHGDRVRTLYAGSAGERAEWISALARACRCGPIEDEYEVGEEIGRGQFAHVFRATRRVDGQLFAVKVINKAGLTDVKREMLRTEIAIVKLVQHPHVVRVEAIYETGTTVYIVMEYMERGELFQNLIGRQRFSEGEARRLARQLVECLVYLHSMGVIHRDIKPENIMCEGARPASELAAGPAASGGGGGGGSAPVFDVSRVKIGDFGLSKLVHPNEVMTQPCGSPQYVAPEVLSGGGYGKEADMWSVGIILHLVVRGRLPFDDPNPAVVYARTLEGVVSFDHPAWASWSPEGMSFIRGLLEKDRTRRLTARRAMQHPWLRVDAGSAGSGSLPLPALPPPVPAAGSGGDGASGTAAAAVAAADAS